VISFYDSRKSKLTRNDFEETSMGVKLSELGNDGVGYRQNVYEIGKKLLMRLLRPWLFLNFTYSLLGYRKELDKFLEPAHNFTRSIIAKRKQQFEADIANGNVKVTDSRAHDSEENIYFRSRKQRYAMMDTLLQAQRDGLIDDAGIQEETDTFTFEGHDTTSSGLSFSILLLAHNPEAQDKILKEIDATLKENQADELTLDDFNKLNYLDRALKECLRIYPPVAFISRAFSEDFHLGKCNP